MKRLDDGLLFQESDEPLDIIIKNVLEVCNMYKKERIKEIKEEKK